MSKFNVGDKVRIIIDDLDNNFSGLCVGDEFKIKEIDGIWCRRKNKEYDGVDEKLLELVSTPQEYLNKFKQSSDEPNKQRTIKMKLNTMMKKLLDKDTKTLIKADFVNGDLQLTSQGQEALNAIIFEANKAELVKIANEKLAEEKEEKC